jgi:protein arginine kinase activator
MAYQKPKPFCEGCKKKPTIHLTEIIDGKITEMHLCDDCPKLQEIQSEKQFGIADLLAGLADFGKSVKPADKIEIKCKNCGLTYDEFRKFGRFGCSECYTSFKAHLTTLLKKIHGSTHHLGKTPVRTSQTQRDQIEELHHLKEVLMKTIEAEDFEQAAIIRDQIRNIEKESTSG